MTPRVFAVSLTPRMLLSVNPLTRRLCAVNSEWMSLSRSFHPRKQRPMPLPQNSSVTNYSRTGLSTTLLMIIPTVPSRKRPRSFLLHRKTSLTRSSFTMRTFLPRITPTATLIIAQSRPRSLSRVLAEPNAESPAPSASL